MRLLRIEDGGNFSLVERIGNDIPPYAILSHTWGADEEEVTYRDLVDGTGSTKSGYRKIWFCGKQAVHDGLQFFWVDTCAIDKSSSAELSEAINSMFLWYQNAAKCYVYLSDVSVSNSGGDDEYSRRWKPAFKQSRWFTRGWTLQELVAPALVEFFSREGARLGDKLSLKQTLHEITGIPIPALEGNPMHCFSVDERLRWAERRQTKREEDTVYSLLGIFDIHMPLLYGEGRRKAWDRLLKEIRNDESLDLPIAKGASFDSHVEEHNARCLPNTRTELLHQIEEWASERKGKPIFWLNGMAGTGKSTIARTVAQMFADQHRLGASFFFKRGEGKRGNATRFFTTIATHLMCRIPEMRLGVRKAVNADPAILDKALKDQFEKLILQPLSEIKPSNTLDLIVAIDALDECEQDEDIRVILRLLSRIKDPMPVSLRIFVTSRPEVHIRLGFQQMPNGTYQDLILHQVSEQTIKHDIRLFLEHELRGIREQRSLSPRWPSKDQIEALVKLAVPLFISAATACRYIGDHRDNPKKRLDIVLQYQDPRTSKLTATYLPILNQLFDDEEDKERWSNEFQEIVGSIVVLESALSITSLTHLLGIPRDDIRCRLDSLHSVLDITNSDNIPVRLLHLSFRDFLVDYKRKDDPFWIDERETHEKLAIKCIEVMSSVKGVKNNICNLPVPGIPRSEIAEQTIADSLSPELRYACRYWVHHLEQSTSRIYDGDRVYLFLQEYFLYWLEALSLISENSIHIVNSLQKLTHSDNSLVSRFLYDAERFVLRFGSIIKYAPLQVYYSALIFAPDTSIIRRKFAKHIRQWASKLSTIEPNWNACRSTLEGHSDWINAITFSPDGQLLASASEDMSVRIWDVTTGSCRSTLEGHLGEVFDVAFSPNGQLIASSSSDKTIRLWEASTGFSRGTLKAHSNSVFNVSFSPDGQLLVSASKDMTIRLWDATTGSCLKTLKGHSGPVLAAAFSPDGQLLASKSDDMTMRLWDIATGLCRSILEGHSDTLVAMAFSPNGQLIASLSSDKTLRLWEVATGSCRITVTRGQAHPAPAVAFSADSELIASAYTDGAIELWEAATGSCHSTLRGHLNPVTNIVFSPDGQLVASTSGDATVRIWVVATGSCHSIFEGHLGSTVHVAFSPNGQLLASASKDMMIQLWEVATGFFRSTSEGHSEHINAVAFSPDGQLVASASSDKTVRLWETATGSCHATIRGYASAVSAVTFSPDGRLVASASYDTLRIWEVASESYQRTLTVKIGYIEFLAFSPDSQLIALVASWDEPVQLWDVVTESCRSTLWDSGGKVYAVAFSPDSQLVASASIDRTVRLWEATTGSCRTTLRGHSDRVTAVAFSPDGKLVVSVSADNTVRLWNTMTEMCCTMLEARSNLISTIAFSPDGQYLETNRGQILLFPPSSGASSVPKTELSRLFVKDQWVTLNERDLLWLPYDYRPHDNGTTSIVVFRNVICLGDVLGNVTFLKINTEEVHF